MDRHTAAHQLAGLFADRGAALLADADAAAWDDLLDLAREALPDDPGEALEVLRDDLWAADDLQGAAACARAAVARRRVVDGDGSVEALVAIGLYGGLLVDADELDDGSALIERAWEGLADAPPTHPGRARVMRWLGRVRVAQRRYSEAIFPLRQAIPVLDRIGDEEAAADAAFHAGVALIRCDAPDEGRRLVERAVRWTRQAGTSGDPHHTLPARLSTLAVILGDQRSPRDAEPIHREAAEAARLLFGEHSPEHAERQAALAGILLRSGRRPEAVPLLEVASRVLLDTVGPNDPRTRQAAAVTIDLLFADAQAAEARKDRALMRSAAERAGDLVQGVFGYGDARLARAQEWIVKAGPTR